MLKKYGYYDYAGDCVTTVEHEAFSVAINRLLVVGPFSKGRRALLYRELGEPPGGMDGKGLGRDEDGCCRRPATEKLTGQFKLCARNGVKDLAINCFFICTRAALARYKLCFQDIKST